MSIKKDLKQLFKPYYLFNIFLSLSYMIFKRIPGVCNYLFDVEECEFDGRETEILFFLLIVVMIRTRKAGSVTMIKYLSSSFIYTKVANLILWFYADFVMGLIYGIVFVLSALLIPEPTYVEAHNVIYFRGANDLGDELKQNKNKTWLVTFYSVYNPACVNFAPIFAELSIKYDLDNLKFGKVDVGRCPEAGLPYKIDDSMSSKQLPTVILFKDGKEVTRRPTGDTKGKIIKFSFTEEAIKSVFDLNNLYEACKNNTQKHVKND